jgi:type III secretory pathway component EscU
MIHYINNKPHKNINMTSKPTRHALAAYRHTQRVNKAKEVAGTLAIMALFATLLTATVYLIVGLN